MQQPAQVGGMNPRREDYRDVWNPESPFSGGVPGYTGYDPDNPNYAGYGDKNQGAVGGNAVQPPGGFSGSVGSGGGTTPSGYVNPYVSGSGGYGYAPAGAATQTAQGEQIQPRNQWDGSYYTASGRKLTPQELQQYGLV